MYKVLQCYWFHKIFTFSYNFHRNKRDYLTEVIIKDREGWNKEIALCILPLIQSAMIFSAILTFVRKEDLYFSSSIAVSATTFHCFFILLSDKWTPYLSLSSSFTIHTENIKDYINLLKLIFLMINDAEHLLWAYFLSGRTYLLRRLFKSFTKFLLNALFLLLVGGFQNYFNTVNISPLSKM